MKLLVVDDDEITRKLLHEVFVGAGYTVGLSASAEEAIARLSQESFDVILSDIRMLKLSGMAILSFVKKNQPKSVVILMTGFGNMEGAIRAIQEGAFDYISKPFKIDQLKELVARAFRHWKTLQEKPAQALDSTEHLNHALIGKSPQMLEVYKAIAHASMTTSSVFIVGEKGTGRSLIAQAIFDKTTRADKKYLSVNGANLGSVLDSLSSQAAGTTIFVDNVDQVPAELQEKWLADFDRVRWIVSASSTQGIREDLLYRLQVISVHAPSLRERKEDLPELIQFFVTKFCEKNKKPTYTFSPEAKELLLHYDWPGNVTELGHVIERAVAMARTSVLYPEDLQLRDSFIAEEGVLRSLEEVEKSHILHVLQETGFNKTKAAEVLGIDRATLYRKTLKYGINLGERGTGEGSH